MPGACASVCPVRQELENEAVRGEFLLCFWGKKEGGAKGSSAVTPFSYLFRREANLCWLGQEGRGDVCSSSLSSCFAGTEKKEEREEVCVLLSPGAGVCCWSMCRCGAGFPIWLAWYFLSSYCVHRTKVWE